MTITNAAALSLSLPIASSSAPSGSLSSDDIRALSDFVASGRLAEGDYREALNDVVTDDHIAFTPDLIVATVRQRLRSLDSELGEKIDRLEDNANAAELLNNRQRNVSSARRALARLADPETGEINLADVYNAPQIKIDGEMKNFFQALRDLGLLDNAEPPLVPDVPLDLSEHSILLSNVDSVMNELQSEARSMNSGNELLMLSIQTLTQQRSQVIQLGTSLVQKVSQSEQAIAQNIGR